MGGDADEGAPPSKRARLNHYLEYSVLLGRGGDGGGGAGGGSCGGGEGGSEGGGEGEEGQEEGGGRLGSRGADYPFRGLTSASASCAWRAGAAAFAFLPLAMAGKPCGSADGGGDDATEAAAAAAAGAGAPLTLEGSLGRLPAVDAEETIGSKGQIRKSEFIRIIAQALYSLGYNGAASRLEEESGVCLQSPAVASFRDGILGGRWDECVALLGLLQLDDSDVLKRATFEILQQKFLELLEQGKSPQALKVLRCELGALGINTWRLHQLASCVMCTCKEDLMVKAGWSGSSLQARYDLLLTLQHLLPPSVLIPERRLEALVEQALSVQRENCLFHNTREQTLSLLSDHQCGKNLIPSEATAVLEEHTDEVWYVQFSHDGTRLATASKDSSVIVWQVFDAYHVKLQHKLVGHEGHLSFVAWSPDDKMLLTCGQEKFVKLWDTMTGECKRTFLKHTELVSACAWFPDNRRFVTGGSDKCIYFWGIDGTELDCHKTNSRISDLTISQDGLRMISAGEKEIKIHRFDDKSDRTITLDNSITSLCISRDDRYMLASLDIQEIHLWDLNAKPLSDKPTFKYKGQKRVRFVIRSCFGGSDEAFIASGSEDSQVYIWLRRNGELVEKLAGHSGTVNAVSWNPVNPHMFASASDDKTVRLWGLSTPSLPGMNGYHGYDGLGNGNAANGALQLTAASNGNC